MPTYESNGDNCNAWAPNTPGTWAAARGDANGVRRDPEYMFRVNDLGCLSSRNLISGFMNRRCWVFVDTTALSANWAGTYNAVKLRLRIFEWTGQAPSAGVSRADLIVTESKADKPVEIHPGGCDITGGSPICYTNDYGDQVGYETSGGSYAFDDWSSDSWIEIVLNSTGMGWINPGGFTPFCLRTRTDVDNTGASMNAGEINAVYLRSYEADPTLAAELYFYNLFPTDSVARVSSIRHICRPGFYRMQVGLGDIGFDTDVAEATVRKALDTATEAEPPKAEPPPPMREPQIPGRRIPRPGIIEPPPRPGAEPAQPSAMERLIDIARRQQEQEKEEGIFAPTARITAPQPKLTIGQAGLSLWQRITPWKEEEGETFGGEVAERFRSATRWLGGLFR